MTRQLTPFDLTPYYRNSVGIGRITDMIDRLDAKHTSVTNNYPPYNIIDLGEDKHRIEIAVAGFSLDDISVRVENDMLEIEGQIEDVQDEDVKYVHRGLSGRKFRRSFELVDHVEVIDATLKDGILMIDLERIVPEALKPKQIKVKAA